MTWLNMRIFQYDMTYSSTHCLFMLPFIISDEIFFSVALVCFCICLLLTLLKMYEQNGMKFHGVVQEG